MKTVAIALYILFCFASPVFAADNDFTGMAGILWQQHIDTLPYKLIKHDTMEITVGKTVEFYHRDNDPILQELPEVRRVDYLFENGRFISIIYMLKDVENTLLFMAAIMKTIGDPDNITDKDDQLQLLWIRRLSIVFGMTAERAVMIGERVAMAEIIEKWGAKINI